MSDDPDVQPWPDRDTYPEVWQPILDPADPPTAPELTVEVDDDEPVGILYGPDGDVLTVVYPDRLPFGFGP